jgi:CotH kinase protein
MRNKLGSCLILSLAINTLIFSGSAQALNPIRFDLQLNGIGVGVDSATDVNNKKLYYSLGKGFSVKTPFSPILKYSNAGNYRFFCNGIKVNSGSPCSLGPIKYGDTQTIKLYNGSTLTETYTLVFTNLPVIQVNASGPLFTKPKIPGDFRLMSGELTQDTGKLVSGVDLHGQTTLVFDKKSKGINFPKNKKIALLDMAAGDDWILDASYADTTFARNNLQMDIFNEIHKKDPTRPTAKHAIQGRITEVIFNGKYDGVYILNQHVGPTLLNLKPVVGTNIYKFDYAIWKTNLFFPYTKGNIEFNISQSYPSKINYTPIKNLIDFVIASDEFAFTDSIMNRIDLDSLADWYLMSQAFQDDDNSSKNFYLAQNPGKPFFIVPWDTGSSFGIYWDGSKQPVTNFFEPNDNNLIVRLLKYPDTGFNDRLKKRWAILKNTVFLQKNVLARFAKINSQLTQGSPLSNPLARDLNKWKRPVTIKTPRIINNKVVYVPIQVGLPETRTPKYITDFLKVRLPALNTYINNLPS